MLQIINTQTRTDSIEEIIFEIKSEDGAVVKFVYIPSLWILSPLYPPDRFRHDYKQMFKTLYYKILADNIVDHDCMLCRGVED